MFESVAATARDLILRDEGLPCLKGISTSLEDFIMFFLECNDDMMPTVVEATLRSVQENAYSANRSQLMANVNVILAEERVAFELVEGEMVPFQSKELHQSVVVPTLQLLSARRGWESVEKAYQDALKELADGRQDAITDAGTALQETLTVLDCNGNALGALAKSALHKGLLAPHDSRMVDTIKRLIDWVAADRSEKGDAHNATPATRDDAWLTVHVVGALILRLTGSSR